jgi:hypothetical protein
MPLRIRYWGFALNVGAAGLTYAIIEQLQFQRASVNVVAKGSLALVVYASLVYLLNPDLRAAVSRRFGPQLKLKVAGASSDGELL